jgi:hypothetical protein
MKHIITAALVAIGLAMTSSPSLARHDGTITFTGRIVAPVPMTPGTQMTVTGIVRGESGNCRLIVHDVTHVWSCWAPPKRAPAMGSITQVSGTVARVSANRYAIQQSTKTQP